MSNVVAIETANRLRISGAPPSAAEIADTKKALQKGRELVSDTDALIDVVWQLFREAMQIQRSEPDQERSWLSSGTRVSWPAICHTSQEMWEADLQRLIDLKMSREEPPQPRLQNNDPTAISRMLTVLSWLRHVRGRHPDRDRVVFLKLASGVEPRFVKRVFGYPCSDSTVRMTKERVLQHIASALRPYASN